MRRPALFFLAVILLSVPACTATPPGGGTTPSSSWRGTIEDRNGVVYVDNPAEGLWEGSVDPPLRFELETVYGVDEAPEEAILGAIGALVVDDDGNVYVFDTPAAQLVSFAPDGTVRWRVGRAGEGPGEFTGVRGMVSDGATTLYVHNGTGTRLDLWGLDGVHRAARQLSEAGLGRMYMGGFLPPARLALIDTNSEMAANDYAVVDLGDPLRVVERFRIGPEPMVMIPPGYIFQLSQHFDGDRIFAGNWGRYVLRVFDDHGALLRHVSRPVDYLRSPGFARGPDSFTGMSFGGLAAPIVLAGGHWLAVASWPRNVDDPDAYTALEPELRPDIDWASSLDLFDREGRFLYSIVSEGASAPEIGRPWTVGPRGGLYTVINDPFPQVRRYRVVLDPPPDA